MNDWDQNNQKLVKERWIARRTHIRNLMGALEAPSGRDFMHQISVFSPVFFRTAAKPQSPRSPSSHLGYRWFFAAYPRATDFGFGWQKSHQGPKQIWDGPLLSWALDSQCKGSRNLTKFLYFLYFFQCKGLKNFTNFTQIQILVELNQEYLVL